MIQISAIDRVNKIVWYTFFAYESYLAKRERSKIEIEILILRIG